MNQAEILEKARELGMMIAESDEFKKLKETEQAQLADPDAQQMMADYNAKREEFAQIASRDDLTKEDWEKLNMDAQAEFIKKRIDTFIEFGKVYTKRANFITVFTPQTLFHSRILFTKYFWDSHHNTA